MGRGLLESRRERTRSGSTTTGEDIQTYPIVLRPRRKNLFVHLVPISGVLLTGRGLLALRWLLRLGKERITSLGELAEERLRRERK